MQNSQQETLRAAPGRSLFALRLIAGIFQGFALYLLLNAAHNRSIIATFSGLFFPLLLVILVIPPTLIVGLPRMSGARLAMWAAALGMPAAVVERPGEVSAGLIEELMSRGGPALLDARIDASQRIRGGGRVEALQHMSMLSQPRAAIR